MSKRTTYDDELKKILVNLILNGKSLKGVSREFGVILFFGEKNTVILVCKVM